MYEQVALMELNKERHERSCLFNIYFTEKSRWVPLIKEMLKETICMEDFCGNNESKLL